jgi:hypothetical protein
MVRKEGKGMKQKKQELKREITYQTEIKAESQEIESYVLPQEVCSISRFAGGGPSSDCVTRVLSEHAALGQRQAIGLCDGRQVCVTCDRSV